MAAAVSYANGGTFTSPSPRRSAPGKTPKLNVTVPVSLGFTEEPAVVETAWKPMVQSTHARNTINPIRQIVDAMAVAPNPKKSLIKLHLGDPTLTGKLPPCPVVTEAMHEAVASHKFDGYGPAVGSEAARQAIVDKYSCAEAPFGVDDVILASGASHALQLAIEAIANPGDNILIPGPGFPLYKTLCAPQAIDTRQYPLDMHNGGQINLKEMERLINERTRAIVINNPSNPTGVVYTKKHLEDILRIAHQHRIPIIADEIYGDLVYGGATFHPLASLSPKVPIITCDGIAKRWLVPGWRLGWCIIHDRHSVLSDIKMGMVRLSQKIVGPCQLVQGALPKILKDTPASFFDTVKGVLSDNADIVFDSLSTIPGLYPVKPQGAMYMMVGIDERYYGDETSFVQGLIREQSVFCLPGVAFSAPGWFRVVLAYPQELTAEACDRIREYCAEHARIPTTAELEKPPLTVDEGCIDSDDALSDDNQA